MEVKKGYKQSEIGVIPVDWDVVSLNDCLTLLTDFEANGSFEDAANNVHVFDKENYAWYVRATDLEKNSPLSEVRYVDKHSYDFLKKTALFGGEVLISKRGEIGKVYIFQPRSKIRATLAPNLYLLKLNEKVLPRFVYYYFKYGRGNQALKIINASTTLGALYKDDVKSLGFPLPSLSEQEAIAEALSDADALIEALEQLVAKKRQVKQGAMQELLTGKRRLPGFSGEWEEKSLLELAEGKKELFDDGDWVEAEHITHEGIRLIQTGNIGVGKFLEREDKKYIYPASFVSLRCKELRVGDLLVCRLADPAGRACVLPDIGEEKVITSVDVTIFRPPTYVANRVFLANVFSTNEWFRAVNDRSGGTTHKRISRGALGRMKIKLPELADQTAIAEILSDMDAEITALEAKLSKARQVKAGMMSVLLGGRVRLVTV